MKRFIIASRALFLVALAAAVAGGCATPATAGHRDASSRSELRAARILDRHRDRREFPGAVLAVRDASGAVVTVTAGTTSPTQSGAPIDPSTPWIIGSTTKTFVAVVVLQLVQERKLDLDATVEPFFPEIPAASRITIRQLLQHTSGLAEYLHSDVVLADARRTWRARELIAVAVAKGPVSEPGAGYHYANTNYLLLGEIVEQVTSRPWYAEVRRRILEPLGISHTGYAGEPSARMGAGYVIADGAFVEATDRWHPSIGGAAGAMYSTTADLMAFTVALFEGDLLDAERVAEMRTFVHGEDHGYVEHGYGLGLESYTVNDLTILGHMGNASAHGSFIGYDPASRAAVAVQINAANPGPAAMIAAEVLGDVTGKDPSPPPMPSASAGYTFYPYQSIARAGSGQRIGSVRVTTQQVSASYPIVANEGRTQLDLSVAYQRLQFDYGEMTHPLDSVQGVSATAFLRQKLPDAWGVILVGAPGYADDFKGPASLDAVTLTFVGAATYRFNDRLEVGLGAAVHNLFGEPLPMPVASVEWTIADRLSFKSILPIDAELTWLPIDALGLRASLLVSGGNYHGAESVYGVNNPQLNHSAAAADLGVRWFIRRSMHLTVHGGHTLARRFEFSQGRQTVPGGKYDLANGMVYGIDLGFGR